MATKQRATAFAMITLGIGELVATAALMFHHFFGGEGGVTTDRMIDHSLFGLSYASGIQVYYLIVGWTFIAALLMWFLTMTPLGRMANACRDNYERAQFMGYDPRIVRFLQFSLSGFFAGIGGGLYAITYEIVTFDAVAAPLSANALLMAYIGGNMRVRRPGTGRRADHPAAERRQPDVEFLADLCRRAVHRDGDLRADRACRHRRGTRSDLARRASARLACPICACPARPDRYGAGFVGLVELLSFLTIGAARARRWCCSATPSTARRDAVDWSPARCLLVGGVWLRFEASGIPPGLGNA